MSVELVNRIEPSIENGGHPQLHSAWAPGLSEYNATDLEVVGEIPKDIDGVCVRKTEKQIHEAIDRCIDTDPWHQ